MASEELTLESPSCAPTVGGVHGHPTATASVPVIDLSRLNQQMFRSLAVEDIGRACHETGCFKIINHGISKPIIEGALGVASDFFELSEEETAELASDDVEKPVRYDRSLKDGISKPRSFLKLYAHPLSEWVRFWPLLPPDYRERMGKYAMEVRRVALQLMDAILESLGLSQAYLREKLEEGMQVIGVNRYEPRSQGQDTMVGFPPHTDYGCITILLDSCEGLEFIDRNVQKWSAVPEVPDTLNVHIGDYLEVLSNGLYRSVIHRVVLNPQTRTSIASIHGFSMDELVTTPKELVDEQHPNGYIDSNFRDFLAYISNNDISKGSSFIESLRILNH